MSVYKQTNKQTKMNTYKVKQEDLIGQLEGFPIEVVQKMVDEQVNQYNNGDVSVFQCDVSSNDYESGFDWNGTIDGSDFWETVIADKCFDAFFEKYPNKNDEDTFYKYYVSGMNNPDGKVNIALLEEKGGKNDYWYSGDTESALYYISPKGDMKILKCDNVNIDLLEEAGYVELTSKVLLEDKHEEPKEVGVCQDHCQCKENNSYKYYFKGCKDGNRIFENISNKLQQIINAGKHSCKHEAHLYFVLEDFTLCHCGLGAEYILKQLGYEEVKYEPEIVEYNGKKYIKSEFESVIKILDEVHQ